MSFSYIAGIIVGIVFVLALVVVFKVVLKKNGLIRKGIYDERQQIEKGKGFRLGFIVGLVYFILLTIVQLADIEIDNAFWTFVGICLSVGSFAIYCIIKNAYFGYNQTPKGVTILLFVIMLTKTVEFSAVFRRFFGGFSACNCIINKNIDLKREIYYNSIIKFIKRKEKI